MKSNTSKKNGGNKKRSVPDLDHVIQELVLESAEFVKVHSELSHSIPAEDYDEEIIALTSAVANLRAMMRSFSLKFDDTAESVNLGSVLKTIEARCLPSNLRLQRPKSLPVVHVNRRRIEALFSFLIGDAVRARAKRISLTMPRVGHFKLSDDRPRNSTRKAGDHFALVSVGEDGRAKQNIDLFLAKEIIGFYGGGIRVSYTARSVEFDFTLPTDS